MSTKEKMVDYDLELNFTEVFDLDDCNISLCLNIENKIKECKYS